jgi:hypothetical protein
MIFWHYFLKNNFVIASQFHCMFEPKELKAHNKSQGIHFSTKKIIFHLVKFCLSTNITLWWIEIVFLIGINVNKQIKINLQKIISNRVCVYIYI